MIIITANNRLNHFYSSINCVSEPHHHVKVVLCNIFTMFSSGFTKGTRVRSRACWQLIFVLSLLFLDHDSFVYHFATHLQGTDNLLSTTPSSSYPRSTPNNNSSNSSPGNIHVPDNSTVWVVDVEHNQCLGSYGFSACGEMNLWVWRRSSKGIQLQALPAQHQHHAGSGKDNDEATDKEQLLIEQNHRQHLCLGRKRFSNKLKLKSCSSSLLEGGTTFWRYDAETGMLQAYGLRAKSNQLLQNNLFGDIKCITNDHSHHSIHDYAITRKCKTYYTPLKIVQVPVDSSHARLKTAAAKSSFAMSASHPLIDEGEWKCPHTGLVLPRNLDRYFEEEVSSSRQRRFGRQVLVGAGLFTKVVFGMTFKVFTLAWYVEAEVVASSPLFASFRDVPYEDLVNSDAFYALMTQPGDFDRTLFIKAAMTLKRDLVIQGLLEELLIEPKNAKVLLEASKAYTNPDCPEGMEIILTWRQPRNDSITGMMNPEQFEIRFGDTMMILTEEGLAQDLLYQYFRPNPVSPSAKLEYIRHMPLLLSSKYPKYQVVPNPPEGNHLLDTDVVSDVETPAAQTLHYHVNRVERLNFSTADGITMSSAYHAMLSVVTGTYYYNYGDSGVEHLLHLRNYRWYQWNLYLNSIVLQHYPKAWQEEKALLSCIWITALVLIVSLLPPSDGQPESNVIKRKKLKKTRSMGAIKEIYYHKSASTGSPQKLEFAISPKRLAKSQSLMSLSPAISADFTKL